ncbi:MAG: OadG family transporter subunit [Proteobacteria bacterium]|nr:OadG family transporter subunit [Pseudomonadota bacterium]
MAQSAVLIFSGFATVMVVLVALWGVCSLVGLTFQLAAKRGTARELRPVEQSGALKTVGSTSILAQDLPAIVAAVTAAIDKPFRIVNVVAPAQRTIGWNQGTSFVHMTGQRMPWDRITFTNEGKRRSIKFW